MSNNQVLTNNVNLLNAKIQEALDIPIVNIPEPTLANPKLADTDILLLRNFHSRVEEVLTLLPATESTQTN